MNLDSYLSALYIRTYDSPEKVHFKGMFDEGTDKGLQLKLLSVIRHIIHGQSTSPASNQGCRGVGAVLFSYLAK